MCQKEGGIDERVIACADVLDIDDDGVEVVERMIFGLQRLEIVSVKANDVLGGDGVKAAFYAFHILRDAPETVFGRKKPMDFYVFCSECKDDVFAFGVDRCGVRENA